MTRETTPDGLEAAIAHCEGIAELARRAGYSGPSAITNMRTRGVVPAEAVPKFVRATDSTVLPYRFRPDLYGRNDTGPDSDHSSG